MLMGWHLGGSHVTPRLDVHVPTSVLPTSEGSVPLTTRLRMASLLTPSKPAASRIVNRRVANSSPPASPPLPFAGGKHPHQKGRECGGRGAGDAGPTFSLRIEGLPPHISW